jgi:diguanylate cyclase (GGDEF)-like protein
VRNKRIGRPCALLFVDVDHFKALNDTHGHSAGDAHFTLRQKGAGMTPAPSGIH